MFSNVLKNFNGGIRSKYSVASKPSFRSGMWSVYSAKRKTRESGTEEVSVFMIDKRELLNTLNGYGMNKRMVEEVYVRLRREAATLSKMRHPSVVKIIEPLEETKGTMLFVTESVSDSLQELIFRQGRNHSYDSPSRNDTDLDELVIQRGLLQICEALSFLHNTAKFVHLNLEPASVLLDAKGDWKLFGLKFAESFQEKSEYYIEKLQYLQINFDYAAPELILHQKLDPSCDVFSLGCLIVAIYTGSSPLSTGNEHDRYKDELRNINRALRSTEIPQYFLNVLPKLLTANPVERINIESFKHSEFFDNPLVKTINFLDEFPGKLASEKKVFLQGLLKMLPQFPKSTLQKKVLESLLEEVGNDETTTYLLMKNILQIGQNMSQLSFADRILPYISKVKEQDGCQAAILASLDVLLSRMNQKDFESSILPILVLVLKNSDPEHQKQVLSQMAAIVEKLDYVGMKTELFPAVCDLFSKTSSLSVKLESLKSFKVFINHDLDKHTITEMLLPLMANMKTREAPIILAAVDVYYSLVSFVDIDTLATMVIPQVIALSMESTLLQHQFKSLFQKVRLMLDKIEQEKMAKLSSNGGADMPGLDDFSSPSLMGANSGRGTPSATAKPSEPLTFDALISGGSSSKAVMASPTSPVSQHDTYLGSFAAMAPTTNSITAALKPKDLTSSLASNNYGSSTATNLNSMNSMNSLASMNSMNGTPINQSNAFKPLVPANNGFGSTGAKPLKLGSTRPASDFSNLSISKNDFGSFSSAPVNSGLSIPALPKPGSVFGNLGTTNQGTSNGAAVQTNKSLDQYQSLL